MTINEALKNYVADPLNDQYNFELGLCYHQIGQIGASISYMLRCAELSNDNNLVYQALMINALNLKKQGKREAMVKNQLLHALSIKFDRPEVYFHLSMYHERKNEFHESYNYATHGLACKNLSQNNLLDFPGEYSLLFQQGVNAYRIAKFQKSREAFTKLQYFDNIRSDYKVVINNNLKLLGIKKENKTVSCFMYHDEDIMLELHLEVLKDVVDHFIIIEGDHTYSGITKERRLKKLIEKLNYQDKVTVLEVSLPNNDEITDVLDIDKALCNPEPAFNYNERVKAWKRERIQRDTLAEELHKYNDDTVFIVSDCDEIINPKYVKYFANVARSSKDKLIKLPLVLLEGKPDLRVYDENNQPRKWDDKAFICTKQHLLNATVTQLRVNINNPYMIGYVLENNKKINNVGWHFSWMGDNYSRKNKIKSFSHYNDHVKEAEVSDFGSKEMQDFIDNHELKENSTNAWGDERTVLKKYNGELPNEIFDKLHIRDFFYPEDYKVIDYFPYFHETGKELLELRLNLYKDHVDKFIICESNKTQSGNKIEFQLKNYLKTLDFDLSKIDVIELDIPDDLEITDIDRFNCYEGNDKQEDSLKARVRERLQKDALLQKLNEYSDNDVFLVSDSDEMINPDYLKNIISLVKAAPNQLVKIPLVHLEGKANLRVYYNNGNPKLWDRGAFVCLKKHLTKATPNMLRSGFNNPYYTVYLYENAKRAEDIGWHFSWMGGKEKRTTKRKAFTHYTDLLSKLNNVKYENIIDIEPVEGSLSPSSEKDTVLKLYDSSLLPKCIFKNKRIEDYLFDKKDKISVLGTAIVNGVNWLKRLIQTIDYPVENFIVINNNGRNQITKELEDLKNSNHPFIDNFHIVTLPGNIGVAAAWNLIIKSTIMSKNWLIVNHDIAFDKGFLEEMYKESLKDYDIIFGKENNNQGSYDVFLITDKAIDKCGLFDENFTPAYAEDIDYDIIVNKNKLNVKHGLNKSYLHGNVDYTTTGSQTWRTDESLKLKLDHSRILNEQVYMKKKWGGSMTPIYDKPFNQDNLSKFDIMFIRKKYLGF